MSPTETTSLLPSSGTYGKDEATPSVAASSLVSTLFILLQVALLAFFYIGTEYTTEEYEVKE
eukprot:scaffold3910_cov182-Amphora_coffeaeformis.AAC.7